MLMVGMCRTLVATAVWLVLLAVAWSFAANPDAAPDQLFISELAARWRPGSSSLNASFIFAGTTTAAFVALRFAAATTTRLDRVAWATTIGTALLIAACGCFPLPEIDIHNPLAGALLFVGCSNTWLVATALRQHGHPWAVHCRAVAFAQTGLLSCGLAYVVWLWRVTPGPFRVNRLDVQIGERWINPLAPVEWLFFLLIVVLVLGGLHSTPRVRA